MLRFGANLGAGMLFSTYPLLERFDHAAGYECRVFPEYRALPGTEASLAWMREWVAGT